MLAVMSLMTSAISGLSFAMLFDALDGVEHGGVVPALKLPADLLQGEVGHAADLVHGDLPGQGDVLGAALSPKGIGARCCRICTPHR